MHSLYYNNWKLHVAPYFRMQKKPLYSQAHYPWNTRTPATFTRHIHHMVTYAGTSLIYILLLTAIVQFQMPVRRAKGDSNQASLKVLLISCTPPRWFARSGRSEGKIRNITTKCSDKGNCIVGLGVATGETFDSYFWAAANTARWRGYFNSYCWRFAIGAP